MLCLMLYMPRVRYSVAVLISTGIRNKEYSLGNICKYLCINVMGEKYGEKHRKLLGAHTHLKNLRLVKNVL